MTSTVKVSAHCASHKQVEIVVYDTETGDQHERFILQDGETADRVVFDQRAIQVREIEKEPQTGA